LKRRFLRLSPSQNDVNCSCHNRAEKIANQVTPDKRAANHEGDDFVAAKFVNPRRMVKLA
jgi:hypothetical protein